MIWSAAVIFEKENVQLSSLNGWIVLSIQYQKRKLFLGNVVDDSSHSAIFVPDSNDLPSMDSV